MSKRPGLLLGELDITIVNITDKMFVLNVLE
jgi:hypothetical protein